MKQLVTFITCLLFLGAFTPLSAQSKVAHINTQQLLSEMPEVIAANKELEKLEKQYATQLDTSVKEFDTKVKSYSADAENQTDLINQQRQTELQDLQQRIAEFRQTASQELQKKQAEMMRPLYEKARSAIETVAKSQSFEYVLDSSAGGSMILADGKDLLADVKKELGF